MEESTIKNVLYELRPKLIKKSTLDFLQATQIASYGSLNIGDDEILSNVEKSKE